MKFLNDLTSGGWAGLSTGIAKTMAGVAMALLALLIVPAALLVFGFIGYGVYQSIYRLGMVHFAPVLTGAARVAFESAVPVVAGSTVGMPYILGITLFLFHKKLSNTAKGYSTIFLVIGIIELVLMYFYEQALTLKVAYIPVALVGLGALIYAGIGGFNLVPALVVPIVSHGAAHDKHPNISAAIGDWFKFCLEMVLFIAGVAVEFYFGTRLGLPDVYVGMAAFLVGLGFLWTGLRFADAHRRGDRFDMREWTKVRIVFGGYLGIVGALAVAELATDHKDAVPEFLKTVGISLNFFVQALLVAIIIYTDRRTAQIDDVNGDGRDDATGQVIGIRLPHRATAVMNALRGDSKPVAQLPQPATVMMNQQQPDVTDWDMVHRNMEAGLRRRRLQEAQLPPRVSETTGQRYDSTGIVVMPQDEPVSFMPPAREIGSPKS